MAKKIAPKDNSSNMENGNKGTSGTNKQYDQVLGNRGTQMAEAAASKQSAGGGSSKKGGKSK